MWHSTYKWPVNMYIGLVLMLGQREIILGGCSPPMDACMVYVANVETSLTHLRVGTLET